MRLWLNCIRSDWKGGREWDVPSSGAGAFLPLTWVILLNRSLPSDTIFALRFSRRRRACRCVGVSSVSASAIVLVVLVKRFSMLHVVQRNHRAWKLLDRRVKSCAEWSRSVVGHRTTKECFLSIRSLYNTVNDFHLASCPRGGMSRRVELCTVHGSPSLTA